jgi:predicted Zn-dependent protease
MKPARPPRRSKPPRWRAGLLTALLALSSLLTPPVGAQALPALGDGVEISMASERRLGDRIATGIYRDPAWLDDAVLGDYLQAIWQPLVQAALRRGDLSADLQERFAWQLFLVRDRSVNAFALPGGYLGVHTGLLAAVSSADELAAVLAHELSHVTQRHIARMFTQQQNLAPWMMAAMILGVMAASRSPDAASAAIVGSQAVAAQGQLNFSRDMEREADRRDVRKTAAGQPLQRQRRLPLSALASADERAHRRGAHAPAKRIGRRSRARGAAQPGPARDDGRPRPGARRQQPGRAADAAGPGQ